MHLSKRPEADATSMWHWSSFISSDESWGGPNQKYADTVGVEDKVFWLPLEHFTYCLYQ